MSQSHKPKFEEGGIIYPNHDATYISYDKKTYPNTTIYRKLYPYGKQDGEFLHTYKVGSVRTQYIAPTSGYYTINLPNGSHIVTLKDIK